MEDPDNRDEQNIRNLVSMTKIMDNPEKSAEQNLRNLVSMTKRMDNPQKRAEHIIYELQKYKSCKVDFFLLS